MLPTLFPRSLKALLLLLFFLPSVIYAAKTDDPDGKGFTLEIFGSNVMNEQKNLGNFSKPDWGNYFFRSYSNTFNSNVNIYIRTYGDSSTMDFGFACEGTPNIIYSQFLITGYENKNEKYIESLEIDWSFSDYYGGRLHIYSREDTPYSQTESISSIKNSSYYDGTISPSDLNLKDGKTSVVKFSHNVKYIAFVYAETVNENLSLYDLARFSAFRVHFVDEPPVSDIEETETTKLTVIKDIEPQVWIEGDTKLHLIELGTEDSVSAENFNVTVKPNFEEITQPDENASTLLWWEWDQMEGIMKSGQKVDGYYPTDEPEFTLSVETEAGINYLTVAGHFPVSGTYTIEVTSTDENITFDGDNYTTVDVCPNINLMYAKEYSVEHSVTDSGGNKSPQTTKVGGGDTINLSGIKFSDGLDYYYYDEATGKFPDGTDLILYTPGNYLDNIKYAVSPTDFTDESQLRTCEDHVIDVSALNDSEKIYITVMIEKNGLKSETIHWTLEKTNDNTMTSVEDIEAEEADAEYYDLNGLRVNANNLTKGIYIVKKGNTVTKVIR